MPDIIIPSIVEGHGEVKALPVLLRRLLSEHAPQMTYSIPQPIRLPKSSFTNRASERKRTIELATRIGQSPQRSFILILFDADESCPATSAPPLLAECQDVHPDYPLALTLAKREFESWFLAAAESLRGKRMLPDSLERPANPEVVANAKGWIRNHRSDKRYSETIDQPAYCAQFSFEEARSYSPSFEKFYRDFAKLLNAKL